MKLQHIAFAVVTVVVVASPAQAAPLKFASGFLTGNSYVGLSESDRVSYAEGFVDALLVSPVVSGSTGNFEKLSACTRSLSNRQIAALFDKYLRDHPKDWQGPMNIVAAYSLEDACGISHTPPGQPAGE